MPKVILITGSEGLIGTSLRRCLTSRGLHVRRFDIRRNGRDVLDRKMLGQAVSDCDGVVHLAAVSRVIWGERDPERCWQLNVEGTRNALLAASNSVRRPWVIFASSREVYGNVELLPATEDSPLRPCNVYGRSKLEAERLCMEARDGSLRTAIVRLSNVYGSTQDHLDRVVPCFARLASQGDPLRIEGREHTFDFTHVDDTVRGIACVIDLLLSGAPPPPAIHFLTGQPTTLYELAQRASSEGGGHSRLVEAAARTFDVARFYGDPARARHLLGWQPRVSIGDGLARLVRDFTQLQNSQRQLRQESSIDGTSQP